MNLATNLFLVFMVYTILNYIKFAITKDTRVRHQGNRKRIEELRKIPRRTLKEQKEFLDLKFPRKPPFKWTFKNISLAFIKTALMVGLFFGVRYLWKTYIPFEFALWHVILIAIFIPMCINFVLKKYNLQQDDLLIFFK